MSSKKPKKLPSASSGISVLDAPGGPPAHATPPGIDETSAALVQIATQATDATATIWHRGQRVAAVWSKAEERNSWVAIRGLGWKKLSDASDSANLTLTLLASQALQTARNIDYREESDGAIHEIYLW